MVSDSIMQKVGENFQSVSQPMSFGAREEQTGMKILNYICNLFICLVTLDRVSQVFEEVFSFEKLNKYEHAIRKITKSKKIHYKTVKIEGRKICFIVWDESLSSKFYHT